MDKNLSYARAVNSDKKSHHSEHENAQLIFENSIWLSTEEAARFLRRSSHALRQLVYKGKIVARKFAGRLYFKRSELHELIDTSFN